jgi:hypothetical protein
LKKGKLLIFQLAGFEGRRSRAARICEEDPENPVGGHRASREKAL